MQELKLNDRIMVINKIYFIILCFAPNGVADNPLPRTAMQIKTTKPKI
jgi:hypothetical protein